LTLIVDHWAFLWTPKKSDIKAMATIALKSFSGRLALAQAAHKGLAYADMKPEFRKSPCSMHDHVGDDKPCPGFESYSFVKTVLNARVWTNTILPEESSEDEGDADDEGD
jgi:hypothetical protein